MPTCYYVYEWHNVRSVGHLVPPAPLHNPYIVACCVTLNMAVVAPQNGKCHLLISYYSNILSHTSPTTVNRLMYYEKIHIFREPQCPVAYPQGLKFALVFALQRCVALVYIHTQFKSKYAISPTKAVPQSVTKPTLLMDSPHTQLIITTSTEMGLVPHKYAHTFEKSYSY